MSEQRQPLFLARQNYRQRRTADAARLLPILGIFLMVLPLFWSEPAGDGAITGGTSRGTIYLFVVWILLIAVAGYLSRKLRPTAASGADVEARD